ncbi:hypothetical protein [Devosia aquimaris]|uniref:hypothetical protein n=1 Tax=Devosia aquimaris TaxID=2866214 RepID=UPI001CD0E423|nr:hypothetical protein [Devosia sp. CJK-A8-3]
MDTLESISIDFYPWAAPSPEQRAAFDALSPADKRKAILAAIEEGFDSPISEKSIDDIIRETRDASRHAS